MKIRSQKSEARRQKSEIRNQISKHGYTLVELLAVTSIIVIVSGLIVGVLYSTFRGGNKTRVTNDVSQNGNFALSVISNTAILSDDIVQMDGNPVTDCTTQIEAKSIEFQQQNGNTITFACDDATDSITSTSEGTTSYLIDNSTVRVDYNSCNFTCFQSNNNPYSLPIIGVTFTVSQRSAATTFENVAQSSFKTSVTMRNFSPR